MNEAAQDGGDIKGIDSGESKSDVKRSESNDPPGSGESPSVEVNVTAGLQAGIEISGLGEVALSMFNIEVFINNPDKKNDGKATVEPSVGISLLDLIGISRGMESDFKSITSNTPYRTVKGTTLLGVQNETKTDVLGRTETSRTHTIFAIKFIIGIEFKAALE